MRRRAGSLVGVSCALLVWAPAATADEPDPLYALVDAATQRLQVAEPVAAAKWVTGGSIEDPQRVGAVLDAVAAQAEQAAIDPGYVRTVFGDQIAATEAVEYSRFADWKFDGGAPTAAPDLAESRGLIDALNRQMVEQIAAQWPLLHSAQCRGEVDRAVQQVADRRQLDGLYRRALSAATRSYC